MECEAAVGLLVRGCEVLMIKRAPDLRDPFFWNVSFPGGRVEKEDRSCLETVIREVWEEISVSLDRSYLLGRLPMISPLTRRLRVIPFLFSIGNVQPRPGEEVEAVIWINLSRMKEGFALIPRRNIIVRAAYYGGYVVWGMSYRLLKLLSGFLGCEDRALKGRNLALKR